MSTIATFSNLPSELHELIISFLDYFPLISLVQTNHYFHSRISRDHIKHALLDLERRAARESRPLSSFKGQLLEGQWTMLSSHLPCYKCLRGLPAKTYFLSSQGTDKYGLNAASASKRKCTGCFYHNRPSWLSNSELFCTEGTVWIDCVKCKRTKHFGDNTDFSNLAWLRGQCCFDCYWAGRSMEDGEVNLVPVEIDGRQKMYLEIPVGREEFKSMLKGIRATRSLEA